MRRRATSDLTADSPAIDAIRPMDLGGIGDVDVAGVPVPQGFAPDIGAHEFSTESLVPSTPGPFESALPTEPPLDTPDPGDSVPPGATANAATPGPPTAEPTDAAPRPTPRVTPPPRPRPVPERERATADRWLGCPGPAHRAGGRAGDRWPPGGGLRGPTLADLTVSTRRASCPRRLSPVLPRPRIYPASRRMCRRSLGGQVDRRGVANG